MEHQTSRNPFLIIPRKKLDDSIDEILENHSDNGVLTPEGALLTNAVERYYYANIPVDYWFRDMFNFIGPPIAKEFYEDIVKDVKAAFREGKSGRLHGPHGVGKMQDLETELPTPDRGFVKLKDLKEGDKLFDENGDVCTIIKLHPIDLNPQSYLVTFDDGEKIKVCKDHLWYTWTLKDRHRLHLPNQRLKRRLQRRQKGLQYRPFMERESPVPEPSVKSTEEIFKTLRVNKKQQIANHSIPVTKPLKYPVQDLPIHPYVLGCWLGDGCAYNAQLTTADVEILKHILECGFKTHLIPSSDKPDCKSKNYGIEGLHTLLRKHNLIRNKHIPNVYLIASIEQRLALVRGLLDTDGSCLKSGLIEFSNSNENIAKGFRDLVVSLGIKANIKKTRSFLYGKQCKDRYRVSFTTTLPVFKLQRKLNNQRLFKTQELRTKHRYITSVVPTNSVPMRCLTVDSKSHLYLVTRSCIPTHNTLSVCCILKRVLETGQYSGLYVNLTDIIHVMLSSTQGDKTLGREILLNTNFLVIDEVDTRFMGTENAADLFGRILEPVIRARIQNKMPTFLCSNSISVEGSFSGPLQASMESLLKVVRRITLPGGEDARNLIKSGDL